MSAVFSHKSSSDIPLSTYSLATTLVEGADCGVKLFDRQRHGGQQRGGKSSPMAFVVCLYAKKLIYSLVGRVRLRDARWRSRRRGACRIDALKRDAKRIVGQLAEEDGAGAFAERMGECLGLGCRLNWCRSVLRAVC
jgi:hypothetical protein